MKKMFKKIRTKNTENDAVAVVDPVDILLSAPNIGRMTNEQRKAMTTSCHDTDYIPKVENAGQVIRRKGKDIQVLHNGIVVEADGYVGEWMTEIIKDLRGHHEPHEEKAFYEVFERIDSGATMIELGSYWAYYSLWFSKRIKNARNICLEPDPKNIALGKRNAKLNGNSGIDFLKGAISSQQGGVIPISLDSNPSKVVDIPAFSVDGIMKMKKIEKLDLLHMDVQGFELETLKGVEETIKSGKLRFLFVSTHHYLFSRSVNTHADCLTFIKKRGGHIISSHTIPESFSGDGLIVASFDERDKDFTVDTSINHTDAALFRTYEDDLQILIDAYRAAIIDHGEK